MKLKHKFENIEGKFIKEFQATGRPYKSYMIELDNGKRYCAPSFEFKAV